MRVLNVFLFLKPLNRKYASRSYYFVRLNHTAIIKFEERVVTVNTCGDLYKKWRKEKRFSSSKLPSADLSFEVPYIDTLTNLKQPTSTALLLHGAPGSWKDFEGLASFLTKSGIRVISPSFPDFHISKPGIFRHTDEERAQYIQDFLHAISISKVTRNVRSLQLFVKSMEYPILLEFYKRFGPFILRNIVKPSVRFENVLDPLLSATAMVNGNILESKEKFLNLVMKKIPILFVFSDNDPLIGKTASYELANLLGAKFSDIFIYDKDCNLVQKGLEKPELKVVAFQEGSHYVFWKHPQKVNEIILKFVRSL